MASRAQCNRAHSAVTLWVTDIEGKNLNIHNGLSGLSRGQLPFLGFMSYLREDLSYTIAQASHAWTAIGLIGMVGGFIMGSVADKFSVHKSLVLTYLLLGIATGLFLHHSNPFEVYLAAAIFGLAFNAIFGLVPAFVSLNFSKDLSTLIFGIATVLLGLGSMLGNLWGGMIHDYTQSFLPIYQISTITAFVLALLALVLGRYTSVGNL